MKSQASFVPIILARFNWVEVYWWFSILIIEVVSMQWGWLLNWHSYHVKSHIVCYKLQKMEIRVSRHHHHHYHALYFTYLQIEEYLIQLISLSNYLPTLSLYTQTPDHNTRNYVPYTLGTVCVEAVCRAKGIMNWGCGTGPTVYHPCHSEKTRKSNHL